ncbi:MAG: hypothetical protein LBU84_01230 [Prevotella sp.]|jgi:hypothetical protein|nr:hypothetical protein [Prevotella sp.]
MKYLTTLALAVLAFFGCNKKTDSSGDSEWINKKNLTMNEIIEHVMSDIEKAESFKYTSANSTNVNFYGGQKTNTFLLDKKGNAFSSRNREQNFRIDGKMYTRKTGLKEEGLVATVISDVLDKSTLDETYFERNIPYVKQNGVVNVKMLEKCRITTSVSGNTLTIKTTDFDKIDAKDTNLLTDITITYTPNKEIIHKGTYLKDGKTIITTYSFYINPDEEVKLPKLMKLGEILSPVE